MDGENLERFRAWSYRRQGLDRPERNPRSTLSDIVAVYSSNPTAPLSLLARTSTLSAADVHGLESGRGAIRLPAMRESIFLLPTATAPKIFAATRVPLEKHANRLKYAELTWDDYARIKEAVREIATEPMTTKELQEAIPVSGNLMVAVKTLSREGLVLRVGHGLRSDDLRYVSTSAWLGAPLEEPDPEESLCWLADAYLRTFGPVRVADFAWWAGVTKGRATKAMESLETIQVGEGMLLHADDADSWTRCDPLSGDEIALLPKWDPYTMGYPVDNRFRFVNEEHLPVAYAKVSATSGDGLPLVLRGGKAVATWAHRFQRDRMDVSVTPFEPSDRMEWIPVDCFEPIANLLSASDVNVMIARD